MPILKSPQRRVKFKTLAKTHKLPFGRFLRIELTTVASDCARPDGACVVPHGLLLPPPNCAYTYGAHVPLISRIPMVDFAYPLGATPSDCAVPMVLPL